MNRTLIPTFIGVLTSLFVIWALHQYLLVDDCLASGGSYQYKSGQCLLEHGLVNDSNLASINLVLYFIVGFIISLLVSKLVRKLINIKG